MSVCAVSVESPCCLKLSQSKRDTQKMSAKEVTINITKSIRQSDRRKTKNCVN